jgi:DNA-binding winged helix-turn-helix (wHTH) protein
MSDPAAFEFGPFRLDVGKSVLWRGDGLVPLTPKALALLQALLEGGGDVLSKTELMARVWPDTAVAEANLSVTVAALRKALDPRADGRSYIQTVPRRGYRFDGSLRALGASPRLAIAVLPFSCLGPGIEPHVGFGLADALIGRLTEVEGLLVRPTAAVAHYAKAAKAPREAAAELGVDAVVTGALQRDAARVRISIQVVMRPEALSPWADSFEADWTDLFAVQDALAERVARALSLRFTPGSPHRARHSPGSEAFDAYLRGRFFWARFSPQSLGQAFACFGEAAAADPRRAAPLSGLADCHMLLGLMGLTPPPSACAIARDCAERALALDPDHAEAHVSRALAGLFADWDWDGAGRRLARAVSVGPRSAAVHLWQGFFLAVCGEPAAALRAIARGRELDPLSNLGAGLRCLVHEHVGEHELARALARRAIELRPDHFLGYRCLGLASVRLGKAREGVKALRRAVELTEGGPGIRSLLAWSLVEAGDADEARRELADLDAAGATTFVSPSQRAAVLLALGDREGGLSRLEEGASVRDPALMVVATDPLYASLRGEARFEGLLRRIGFPGRRAAGEH